MLKLRSSRTQRGEPQGDGAAPGDLEAGMIEMSFLDHLEELRWRLIKGFGGILGAAIGCIFVADWIVNSLLLGPIHADFFMYDVLRVSAVDIDLLNRDITGQFFAYWGTILMTGLVIGSPFFLYQMWAFIEPGLYPNEKEGMRFAAVFATFFFITGIAFGYLIIAPFALQFFAQFVISEHIVNQFDITRYFSMIITWSVGAGLLFELPVVVYFLAKVGVLTPAVMRTYRRWAVIIILVISAFLTPPEPLSQIIMAIPIMLLYEGSILIAKFVHRKREKELDELLS